MAAFNTPLCLVFMLGLVSSASPARAPAQSPIATAPNASSVQSPAAPSPASPPATSPTVSYPAFAPFKVATPPSSASSPTVQPLASGPSAEGPDTASPPNPSSGAVSTTNLGKMAIFGTVLVGGAAFLL